MKRKELFAGLFGLLFLILPLTGCSNNNESLESTSNISIVRDDAETHYLKFREDNNEILSLVVLKGETYDDLLPYFPTLTPEPGYIKYWEGDYEYTDYSKDNQFQVYDSTKKIITIYSYMEKLEQF